MAVVAFDAPNGNDGFRVDAVGSADLRECGFVLNQHHPPLADALVVHETCQVVPYVEFEFGLVVEALKQLGLGGDAGEGVVEECAVDTGLQSTVAQFRYAGCWQLLSCFCPACGREQQQGEGYQQPFHG